MRDISWEKRGMGRLWNRFFTPEHSARHLGLEWLMKAVLSPCAVWLVLWFTVLMLLAFKIRSFQKLPEDCCKITILLLFLFTKDSGVGQRYIYFRVLVCPPVKKHLNTQTLAEELQHNSLGMAISNCRLKNPKIFQVSQLLTVW